MASEAEDPDDWLRRAKQDEIAGHVRHLKKMEREEYDYTFSNTAHAGQLPPVGEWRIWLVKPEALRGPQHSHAWRSGAEGVHRERGPRAVRRPASRGVRGRGGSASARA